MSNSINQKSFAIFRRVAFLEGCSYVLFGLTMPLKYVWQIREPNFYVGLAHGLLFVAYGILLLMVWIEHSWKFKRAFLAFFVSLIPFGTFIAEKKDWFKE
jgi:integral membrane protein